MVDIICFSARSEEEVQSSFNNYLDCYTTSRLIFARAPNVEQLSVNLTSKITRIQAKETSLIYRLKELVERARQIMYI